MRALIKSIAFAAISMIATNAKAQSMEASLSTTYAQFDTAKTIESMMQLSSLFDVIANQYSDQWAANYYAAFSNAICSYIEKDMAKRDLLIDEAEKYAEKVKQAKPENDETNVLFALITNARIAVDGRNRGAKYSDAFSKYLEKAKALNANNPRIYYLKGTSLFYTPKFFGGGKEKAKPYFEKAKILFATADKTSILSPYWGQKQNDSYLLKCDEK